MPRNIPLFALTPSWERDLGCAIPLSLCETGFAGKGRCRKLVGNYYNYFQFPLNSGGACFPKRSLLPKGTVAERAKLIQLVYTVPRLLVF
jgi:hypothetical protein